MSRLYVPNFGKQANKLRVLACPKVRYATSASLSGPGRMYRATLCYPIISKKKSNSWICTYVPMCLDKVYALRFFTMQGATTCHSHSRENVVIRIRYACDIWVHNPKLRDNKPNVSRIIVILPNIYLYLIFEIKIDLCKKQKTECEKCHHY